MSGPCSSCLRNSHALALAGGHLEAMKAAWRPKSVLGLEAIALIEAVGGRQTESLLRALSDSPKSHGRYPAACRHQGDFPMPLALADDPEPPWVIWARGKLGMLDGLEQAPTVGLVGARRADAYGIAVARDLARRAAGQGGTVISGLAFGIDGAAHRGALDAQRGRTIAVVGGGVDVLYPKGHRALYEQLIGRGLVISEMPPGTGLWKWSFPARNRLIAALSQLVVVVQGARRSGSLHTAEAALMRGIPVGAVPGRIDSTVSEGSNQLLADGALVINSGDSLIQALGLQGSGAKRDLAVDLKAAAAAVSENRVDDYLAEVGASAGAAALSKLELMGVIGVGVDGLWRVIS